jgi:hypothetical protein
VVSIGQGHYCDAHLLRLLLAEAADALLRVGGEEAGRRQQVAEQPVPAGGDEAPQELHRTLCATGREGGGGGDTAVVGLLQRDRAEGRHGRVPQVARHVGEQSLQRLVHRVPRRGGVKVEVELRIMLLVDDQYGENVGHLHVAEEGDGGGGEAAVEAVEEHSGGAGQLLLLLLLLQGRPPRQHRVGHGDAVDEGGRRMVRVEGCQVVAGQQLDGVGRLPKPGEQAAHRVAPGVASGVLRPGRHPVERALVAAGVGRRRPRLHRLVGVRPARGIMESHNVVGQAL